MSEFNKYMINGEIGLPHLNPKLEKIIKRPTLGNKRKSTLESARKGGKNDHPSTDSDSEDFETKEMHKE